MSQSPLVPSLPLNIARSERWLSGAVGVTLLAAGLQRRGPLGWLVAGVGAAFLFRGSSGYCPWYETMAVNKETHHHGFHVDQSIWINTDREELFSFCRDFENLPQFISHLGEVEVLNTHFSRWIARAPGGFVVEWETEIINEHANEMIAWRSVPESKVDTAGTLRFSDEDGGTRVRLTLQYDPPGGVLGTLVARFIEDPQVEIERDLLVLKRVMETEVSVDGAFQA